MVGLRGGARCRASPRVGLVVPQGALHNSGRVMSEQASQQTLHLEKTLAALPDRVFAACVEAEKLAEWWGPAGFTSPSIEIDLRVGGRYRIRMQPPEGDAFHLRGEYREIDAPNRTVFS